MVIGLTPYSAIKSQPKLNFAENRSSHTNFNKSLTNKTKLLQLSPLTINKLQPKKTNNFLVLSKKTTEIHLRNVADKKGVVLYQQVERSKLLSNGTELINRFNLKA